MKTIIFTGVHGVGKGFFLNKVKEELGKYDVCSASGLISQYKNATDAGYKQVSNVGDNQDVLIKAIIQKQKQTQRNILLDGHICLINANKEVERIPEDFFTRAHIDGIILLQDSVEKILERIVQRDSLEISKVILQKMQQDEIQYAKELNQLYKIPYELVTHECSPEQFEKMLDDMIKGENK